MTPAIRRARADDVEALAMLKLDTFRETFIEGFGIPYPPADLALFEARHYAPETIAVELAGADRTTWVAERDGRLLGYAQVGPAGMHELQADPSDGELYQLYVRNEAQGLGLGRKLLDRALHHLERTRPGPVWLGVWSGNHRAQAIYVARGFEKVGTYNFPVGTWLDEEFVFRRP